jgi:hypothetical protein
MKGNPAGLPRDIPLPFPGVALHRLAASGVELGDAEREDRVAAGDADLFLHFQLCRQAMAIPAEAALNMAAPHGLIARDEILHESGREVSVVRKTVRERRTVIEDELERAPVDQPRAILHGGIEDARALPVFEDGFLDCREVRVLLCLGIGLHVARSVSLPLAR